MAMPRMKIFQLFWLIHVGGDEEVAKREYSLLQANAISNYTIYDEKNLRG